MNHDGCNLTLNTERDEPYMDKINIINRRSFALNWINCQNEHASLIQMI